MFNMKEFSLLIVVIVATSFDSVELTSLTIFGNVQENTTIPTIDAVSRIINGFSASDGQFPYQVRLIKFDTLTCAAAIYYCSGSIIAKNWILTAGHCVSTEEISESIIGYEIQAGEIIADQPRQRSIVSVENSYTHPDYVSNTLENDIGLIMVFPPFNFKTPYVQPIALVAANTDKASYVGKIITVSGWGYITNDGPVSMDLRYTNLTVIDFSKCKEEYLNDDGNPDTSFCAQDVIGKSSACSGDSGGPATILQDGLLTQIGIFSYTNGHSGCNNAPVGFTDLSLYIDWIHKVMKLN